MATGLAGALPEARFSGDLGSVWASPLRGQHELGSKIRAGSVDGHTRGLASPAPHRVESVAGVSARHARLLPPSSIGAMIRVECHELGSCPRRIVASQDGAPSLTEKLLIVAQVVQGDEAATEDLASLVKMAKIRS